MKRSNVVLMLHKLSEVQQDEAFDTSDWCAPFQDLDLKEWKYNHQQLRFRQDRERTHICSSRHSHSSECSCSSSRVGTFRPTREAEMVKYMVTAIRVVPRWYITISPLSSFPSPAHVDLYQSYIILLDRSSKLQAQHFSLSREPTASMYHWFSQGYP